MEGCGMHVSDLQFRKTLLTFCIFSIFFTFPAPPPQFYLTLLTKCQPPGERGKRISSESASSDVISIRNATVSLNLDFNGSSTMIQSHSSTTWDFISSNLSVSELSAANPCKQNRSFILCSHDTDFDPVKASLQEKWILRGRVKDVPAMCCFFIMI